VVRFGALAFAFFLLGGCALPVPLRVAAWALDGISLLATEKSLGDQGLSLMAGRDCALWRGLSAEGGICAESDVAPAGATVIAARSGENERGDEILNRFETASDVARSPVSVSTVTASAGTVSSGFFGSETKARPSPPAGSVSAVEMVSESGSIVQAEGKDSPVSPRPPSKLAASVRMPDRVVAPEGVTPSGFYFVIGSFGQPANADALAVRHGHWSPVVLPISLDGRTHYRVMVGPFDRDRIDATRRLLMRSGISDAWVIAAPSDNAEIAALPAVGASQP
jgi:hypothetical protein